MSALLWPGDDRAADHFGDAALVTAMLRVEQAWLDGLVRFEVAPAEADVRLPQDLEPDSLARAAEAG